MAVGECLMTWAMVERDLSLVYNDCLNSTTGPITNIGIHVAVFDAVISIDARMGMIAAAINWKANSEEIAANPFIELKTEWEHIRKRVRKGYNKRNEVAHSDIIQWADDNGVQVVRLAPFPTFTNGTFIIRLSHKELMERKSSFEVMARELMKFSDRIREAQPRAD